MVQLHEVATAGQVDESRQVGTRSSSNPSTQLPWWHWPSEESVAIGYQVEGRIHGLAAVIPSPDEGFYNAIRQFCGRRITGTGQIGTGRRAFDWSPLAQVEAR